MKELDFQFIWQYQLFEKLDLKSTYGESIQIFDKGSLNHNQGPDFLNAKIQIGNNILVGQIELHINNKDWYLHKHHLDSNYNNVILHVCLEDTNEIYTLTSSNLQIPILSLAKHIDMSVIQNIDYLNSSKSKIACEKIYQLPEDIKINQFKTRLFSERIIRKSAWIKNIIQKNKQDYESAFYQVLMFGFGIKVNAEVFQSIAESLPQMVLAKYIGDKFKLEALFFGQANMLDSTDTYALQLKKEYDYLAQKHRLIPIQNKPIKAKMLPNSFPTIRLAQFVGFIFNQHGLFSKLIQFNRLEEIKSYFDIEVSNYWKEHYDFGKKYSHLKEVKISTSFFEKLVINIILPFRFMMEVNQDLSSTKTIEIYSQLKSEVNVKTKLMTETLHLENKSAFDSQALNEWNTNYCAEKKCLECVIGFYSLKS